MLPMWEANADTEDDIGGHNEDNTTTEREATAKVSVNCHKKSKH